MVQSSNNKLLVIGDVHGKYDLLMQLLHQIEETTHLCFVGDVIDRGEDSAKIIEWIITNKHRCDCVLGNHEDFMLQYYTTYLVDGENWLRQGGEETLNSYIMITKTQEEKDDLISKHVKFIKELPLYKIYEAHTINNKPIIVSHSMILPYIDSLLSNNKYCQKDINNFSNFELINILNNNPTPLQISKYIREEILWNRRVLPNKGKLIEHKSFFNIFGHTINKEPIITNNFAMIDTGAFLLDRENDYYGTLTGIEIFNNEYKVIQVSTENKIEGEKQWTYKKHKKP